MKQECSKIYIDPRGRVIYSSYYIQGLYQLFGRRNVTFSRKYFSALLKEDDPYSHDAYMALVIEHSGSYSKVIIDFGDDFPIRINGYQWCDVYAKINYNPNRTANEFKDKILSIPPGFGIQIWNIFEVAYLACSNLFKHRFKPQVSIKDHFLSYLSQLKQLRIADFRTSSTFPQDQKDYVFFISSLWPHPNCLTGTNLFRKMFIESCLKNKIDFSGGFWVPDTDHPQFSDFKHLTFSKRIPLKQYVTKTKMSMFVFNTPAVHNCHGWKLGQFLAMNKAIISTPLTNSLPAEMVHGENIHFVEDETQLTEAVEKLAEDGSYRKKLEAGAKLYFEKYAAPDAVIKLILQKLNLNVDEQYC